MVKLGVLVAMIHKVSLSNDWGLIIREQKSYIWEKAIEL